MASRQIIVKHYQRILAAWPVDALRPNISFQKTIRNHIASEAGIAKPTSQNQVVGNDAQVVAAPVKQHDEKRELEQVNALYSFLENRYMKKYPLTERMLKPASRPTHYEDLVKELEEAPKRSWLQAKLNKWKYAFRLR